MITPLLVPGAAPPGTLSPPTVLSPNDETLMSKARELEASFLSEMLDYAGLDDSKGSYFGTAGEDQFGSFLRDAQARQMVDKGGIGLAEQLFHALTRSQNGQA